MLLHQAIDIFVFTFKTKLKTASFQNEIFIYKNTFSLLFLV